MHSNDQAIRIPAPRRPAKAERYYTGEEYGIDLHEELFGYPARPGVKRKPIRADGVG